MLSRLLPRRSQLPRVAQRAQTISIRPLHLSVPRLAEYPPENPERAEDEVDCLIVGAGPAGLSAAIRMKQLEKERGGEEKRVVVLEKGAEVGESWAEDHLCLRSPHWLPPCQAVEVSKASHSLKSSTNQKRSRFTVLVSSRPVHRLVLPAIHFSSRPNS